MPFDQDLWKANATIGEASGAYVNLAITITSIVEALEQVAEKTGIDLSVQIADLERINESSFNQFVEMTGWKPE